MTTLDPPIRVLTWHVHGSYLHYLTHVPVTWYLPVDEDRTEGYGGRWAGWPDSVREIPVAEVPGLELDVVLFQSKRNYEVDQHAILSPEQRRLPRAYLEHDPPREHPTDTRHPVDDPAVTVVHVTPFNDLMWHTEAPTVVIEHGVVIPDGVRYTGESARGITVVNNLSSRGRRLGADLFARAAREVPLDLVGMGSRAAGGIGEVRLPQLPAFEARYRFFFHPARYTSLGLAVCEAMMVGLPVVGVATTELVTVVEDGVSGYVDTRTDRLFARMRELIADRERAQALGAAARRAALERFSIERFVSDWSLLFSRITGKEVGGRAGTMVEDLAANSERSIA